MIVRTAVAAVAVPALLLLSACTGDEGSDTRPPAEVLAEARSTLDETSGVHIELETQELPDGVDGVLRADGIGTHAPAFDGEIKVFYGGITADVPVVAVDGAVYAQLPFTEEYVEIDPADYAAPDPARLMATEGGISSWLTEAGSVQEDDRVRSGDTVLTSYSGTLPGDVVTSVIPSADEDATFDARFSITDEGVLQEAEVTGPFYPGAADVTYTVTFTEYGTETDISRP